MGGEKVTTLQDKGSPLPRACSIPYYIPLSLSPSTPDEDEFI